MTDYALWVLEPATPPEDPAWQGRVVWRSVTVLAESAAFARLAAERWALGGAGSSPGNESPSAWAGFRDEKLYRIRRLPPEGVLGEPRQAEGAVVAAERLG
jgi:hypothetical protein